MNSKKKVMYKSVSYTHLFEAFNYQCSSVNCRNVYGQFSCNSSGSADSGACYAEFGH